MFDTFTKKKHTELHSGLHYKVMRTKTKTSTELPQTMGGT